MPFTAIVVHSSWICSFKTQLPVSSLHPCHLSPVTTALWGTLLCSPRSLGQLPGETELLEARDHFNFLCAFPSPSTQILGTQEMFLEITKPRSDYLGNIDRKKLQCPRPLPGNPGHPRKRKQRVWLFSSLPSPAHRGPARLP